MNANPKFNNKPDSEAQILHTSYHMQILNFNVCVYSSVCISMDTDHETRWEYKRVERDIGG